ncbi:MAG: DNA polymerase/3'-5' exonuclease PolX [Candidatus Aenigmarchaeota archaeon]|nr:DNA polymerase/3'-5' exonuclease PolX [Candidatus Aenigmarchaeota archaeon]
MSNIELANLLFEIADILEVKEVQWKPIAYRKAARSIETLSEDINEIYEKKGISGLLEISGVGKSIAQKIIEYIETGRINEMQKLSSSVPEGIEELMHISGMGPKRAKLLSEKLGIKSVKELAKACKKHKICKLSGFGEKSEQDILLGIKLRKTGEERVLLGTILQIARELAGHLTHPAVAKLEIAGSIRRMKETCKDIDILIISKKPKEIMEHFTTLHEVKYVLAKGETKSTVILDAGIQADLRVLEEKSFGAALQYFTGNKDHNVALRTIAIKKGYKLSEYGLFDKKGKYVAGRTEEEIYKKLGLQYIEPELRENTNEIQTAIAGKLPKLIPYNSIRGDLHLHTNWSDGTATTEQMILAAIKQKYEYLAITDHSPSEHIARGLEVKRLMRHKKEVELLQKKYPEITIFFGSEVSILKEGKLDYPDSVLKQLDWVVASVHSGFKTTAEQMTKRIITALKNPNINALGHPTGRLLLSREPYAVNLEKVYEKAQENNLALEINAFPSRLDLSDMNIRAAKEHKVKFVINTDAHSPDHLRYMELGVAQARRGWLEEKDVLNTLPVKKFLLRL